MSWTPGTLPPMRAAAPLPRRRRRAPVRAWLLGTLGLGLAATCAWGAAAVLGPYVSHDRPELVDHPRVIAALAEPCAAVRTAAAQVDVSAPVAEQATRLADVVVAIDALAASVEALDADLVDGDDPTRSWVTDWETLGSRLTDYSVALANGTPVELDTLVTPDGYTVVTRMDLAAPQGCEVPAVLVALDPTPPPTPPIEG